MHPVLAIDHGSARMGLAATDDLGIAAHAAGTIDVRRTDPVAEIVRIAQERGTKQLVLGLPLRMDGSEGDSANKVRAFGDLLTTALPGVPLAYFDERLTTVSAAEKLHEAGKNARKQKALIDQTAALEILNGWLDW